MDGGQALALLIRPPTLVGENAAQYLALVAAAASTEQDTMAAIGVTAPQYGSAATLGRYVRFTCDQDFTIAFGSTGMGAPVIGSAGFPLKADTLYDVWVDVTTNRYFRAISASNATFVWYLG